MTRSLGLNDSDDWYLACVCGNTRVGGIRELWGSDERNRVRLDQERDSVSLTVAGRTEQIAPRGGLPSGVVVLEIWRNSNNEVFCWANGRDISIPGTKVPGVFNLRGFGFDQSGNSYHDDLLMEMAVFNSLPSATGRKIVRSHLTERWK